MLAHPPSSSLGSVLRLDHSRMRSAFSHMLLSVKERTIQGIPCKLFSIQPAPIIWKGTHLLYFEPVPITAKVD